MTLSEARLKKLETDLEKLLAAKKKTAGEMTGIVKLNADLLAKLALANNQIASLKGDIALRQTDVDKAARKANDQLAKLKLSAENARKLQKLLDSLRAENKDAKMKLQLTELQLKVREQDLDKSAQRDSRYRQ